MTILVAMLSVYAMYILTVSVMVLSAQRRDRVPALFVAVGFPIVVVLAVVHAIFRGRELKIGPCPHGLEEAEALIERKRQVMFNRGPVEPTIAKTWRRRYAMSLELQAQKARRLSLQMKELLATV